MEILRSRVMPTDGFIHGFPERHGGVSTGLRSSLNLGWRWGDDLSLVEQNRALVAAHEGYPPEALQVTKHVHGTEVWRVGEPQPDPPEFDGLVCDVAGPVLGAFAADCIPIVFAAPAARVIGACHAGWRGTVGGVARNVVARMVERGADAADIRVALGPSIGPCCFEVGPEVVEEFRAAFGDLPGMVVPGPHKDHLDLRVATRAILERAGVRPAHIDDTPPCTKHNPERFFSYRRDGKEGGVHMGFIGMTLPTTRSTHAGS
jgi:YfiH family protein